MNISVVLFILAALISTVVCQEPEIVDEIWPEVKPVGRTARLNCTIARKGSNPVVWEHIDTLEIISTDERIDLDLNPIEGGKRKYEVEKRGNVNRITYMLIIRRLRQQDAGKYRCSVQILNGDITTYPSKIGLLTVQVAPTIRSGDTSTVLVVDQGSNSNLTCVATGIPSPNITWVRSDGYRLPTGFAQHRGAILPLGNMTVKMGGVYRCVADNNIKPPAEHLAEVLVFHRPSVRVVQKSYGQASELYDVKLECITQGYPEPRVTWERVVEGGRQECKDDQKFILNKQTTDLQNMMSGEQWYSLKILNIKGIDYTDYYCIARNIKGESSAVTRVFETTECQGPNCGSLAAGGGASEIKMAASFMFLCLALNFIH